ncbi:hypothetical protein KILIM_002_00260 [Kineosphaera limosa NBRC 100340]|uniref:Uncharacterized protein n=1 Tax=Kineosphaera limosa NBRC 100340 TaxID=1184609 RepID=K6X5I9_9MICO|nr:hypothetical protein KILIM_002_00260 [Kineosphaera limosa NBRC 100340]
MGTIMMASSTNTAPSAASRRVERRPSGAPLRGCADPEFERPDAADRADEGAAPGAREARLSSRRREPPGPETGARRRREDEVSGRRVDAMDLPGTCLIRD